MSVLTCLLLFGWTAVLLLQILRPEKRGRIAILLPLSLIYFFYLSSSTIAFFAMVGWILSVYFVFVRFDHPIRTKCSLVGAIYAITVLVCFSLFKLGIGGKNEAGTLLEATLPLGFSFVMFRSLAMLHRSVGAESKPSLIEHLSSVLFFPTIAIGPFHPYDRFKQGLCTKWDGNRTFSGYCTFCLGTLKAGISGLFLRTLFLRGIPLPSTSEGALPAVTLLIGSVFLYANFSGYSDIVVGLAKMMGFDIPPNFRFPFLSCSMAEFWRRWHMSLGSWFKEHFFLPFQYRLSTSLMKNWKQERIAGVCVFLTFFLIGMWHDYSIKLFVYSLANGLLVAYFFPNNQNKWIGIPLTFLLSLLVNGLFLSHDLESFFSLLQQIANPQNDAVWQAGVRQTAFALFCLATFYFSEELIRRLDDSESSNRLRFVVANFAYSAFNLYVGISFGIGRTDTLYVGY